MPDGPLPRPTALLVDFDGTIATVDVTVEVVHAFVPLGQDGEWPAAVRGRGSRAVQEQIVRRLPQDRERLLAFALRHEVDPGAAPLVEAAQSAGWQVEVVSDGLGYYVPAMLERAGITAPARCADLVDRDGELELVTPWRSRQVTRCTGCATCKVDAVEEHHAAGRRVVLVGDGRSDRVAAEDADVVYATGLLAEHCAERGIAFRAWTRLRDVLDDLVARGEFGQAATGAAGKAARTAC